MKYRAVLLLLVCVSCSQTPQTASQPLTDAEGLEQAAMQKREEADFKAGVTLLEQAAAAFLAEAQQRDDVTSWQNWCRVVNQLGWDLAVYLHQHEKAETLLTEAVAISARELGPNHSQTLKAQHNLATVYYYLEKLDEALEINQRLLKLRIEKHGLKSAKVAANWNNLGLVYRARGDLDRAMEYYERSLATKRELEGTGHQSLASSFRNIGFIHQLMGRTDLAIENFSQARDLYLANLPEHHPLVAAAQYNLGMAALDGGRLDLAEEALHAGMAIAKQNMGEDDPHLGHYLWELGRLEGLLNRSSRAAEHLQRALSLIKQEFGPGNYHVAESYNHLAWLANHTGDYNGALGWIEQALHNHDYQIGKISAQGNTTDRTLIRCLQGKAVILMNRYLAEGRIDDLEAGLQAVSDGLTLIDIKRMGFPSQESKLQLNRRLQQILNLGMSITGELYRRLGEQRYLLAAFQFSEQGKMAALRDALDDAHARKFGGVSQQLLAREAALGRKIRGLNQAIAAKMESDGSELEALRQNLLQAHQEQETFVAELEREYPKYHQLKYQKTQTDVAQLQQGLKRTGLTLLAYHMGDQLLTVFALDGDSAQMVQTEPGGSSLMAMPRPADWLAHVETSSKQTLPKDIEQLRNSLVFSKNEVFLHYGRKLYQRLIAPLEGRLAGRNLVIVPDAGFGSLPFETLLTDDVVGTAGSWDLSYLIRDHQISYAYAANLLQDVPSWRLPTSAALFAPVFSEVKGQGDGLRAALQPIPHSEEEARSIAELFENQGLAVQVFTHEEATEANLARVAGDVDVLHLATHGVIDEHHPELSHLVFADDDSENDGLLYVPEVFDLSLNSHLVVLSACDTGRGKIVRGEGVLGFYRAFRYAGAARMLVSHWQVSDPSTTALMTNFYQQLLGGATPSQALHRAKLAGLKRGERPYHWAAFVLLE